MSHSEDAASLEKLIDALDPDAIDSATRKQAQQEAAAMVMVPVVGGLAAVIARTLAGAVKGEVEPHHAKWRLAAAALTLRQECERIDKGGFPSHTALNGAIYEFAVLFPKAPDAPVPPVVSDADLVQIRKPE